MAVAFINAPLMPHMIIVLLFAFFALALYRIVNHRAHERIGRPYMRRAAQATAGQGQGGLACRRA